MDTDESKLFGSLESWLGPATTTTSASVCMKTPNAELRGASQLAGAASRSNAELGEEG